MSKDIKVIQKEKNEIILQEVSKYKTFYSKYGKYITLLIVLSLLFVGGTFILTLKKSNEYVLDNPGVNIVFPDGDDVEIGEDSNKPSIDNNPDNNNIIKDPENLFDDFFGVPEEISFKVNKITLSDKTIYYYSDYSVKITYASGNIIRVLPINNKYSVDELGNINPTAKKSNIKVIKTENTKHGIITYYSDHSAEIEENNLDIWVGKKENIEKYYITQNKLSYLNNIKQYENFSVTYYNDGTIFINNNDNKKYIVRNNNDIVITDNGYIFNYNNATNVIETKKLDNGFIIYYLSDGGAIIEGPKGNVSIRKSNSIVITDNKLIKIKTNNKVKETSRKRIDDLEIIYYNNGSSVVKQNDKIIGYFPDNSQAKYTNDKLINKNEIISAINTTTPSDDTTVTIFKDGNAFIEEKEKTTFEKSDNLVIENGVVAIINNNQQDINLSTIKITNDTLNKVKIRIVLENSKNTTLQNYYLKDIKYKISEDNITKNINNNPWENKNNEYILYETELDSKDSKEYQLGIWLDYTELSNDAMDKYFYGTLKVYSWEQK